MVVPVGVVGEGFVDAVVEVFVVGEDDVAADVVELGGKLLEGLKNRDCGGIYVRSLLG